MTKKLFSVLIFILFLFILTPKGLVFATRSSLNCIPGSQTYNVGDTITVNYSLDTRSFPVYGADIVGTYTSSVLDAVGAQSTPGTTDTKWNAPATNTIDSNLGKIRLDFGKNQASFSGTTNIGQATFKAKAAGQAKIDFVFFQPYDDTTSDGGATKVWGKKDGTNITNILTDVTSCQYVITGVGPTSTPGPAVPTVPPVTSLPRSGSGEVTMSLLLLAALFVTGGMIFPLFVVNRK